jgi:electron transfer flavoprotein alpha/beta subunit
VPAGNSEDANGLRQRQLELVHGIVARGVPPGIMLVFAGPDSGKTAKFVTEAFKDAQPDSFKDVIVLVVGDAADKDKVTSALQRTGANLRYANM